MTMTLCKLNDPAHGWLVISLDDADRLGLDVNSFTNFSFYDADSFYAEEDCDAAVILVAHHRKFGTMPTVHEQHSDHYAACRNFRRCSGKSAAYEEAHRYLDRIWSVPA